MSVRPCLWMFCCATLTSTASGSPQDMIGLGFYGEIYAIDSETGQMTYLSQSQRILGINAMAKDSTGKIYASGGGSAPGMSAIGLIDLERSTLDPVIEVPLTSITGMAFGPNDVLYALADVHNDDFLYTIDLTTGSAQAVGPTGTRAGQSLAFSAGALYTYENNYVGATATGLMTVDTATGLATDVNPGIDSSGAGEFQALCFSLTGELYAASAVLATIDTSTGKRHYVADFPREIRGMEFLDPIANPLRLNVTGECPGTIGAAVTGASSRDVVAFLYSLGSSGPFTLISGPCAGTTVDLGPNTRLAALTNAGQHGNARLLDVRVTSAACGLLRIQALNLTTCETSNVVFVD